MDDQQLFRHGLAGLIRSVPEFELVTEAENGRMMLDNLKALPVLPDIALVDMHMPEMNGVELNEVMQKGYPSIKVQENARVKPKVRRSRNSPCTSICGNFCVVVYSQQHNSQCFK